MPDNLFGRESEARPFVSALDAISTRSIRSPSTAHVRDGDVRGTWRDADVLHGAGQRLHCAQGISEQRLALVECSAHPVAEYVAFCLPAA